MYKSNRTALWDDWIIHGRIIFHVASIFFFSFFHVKYWVTFYLIAIAAKFFQLKSHYHIRCYAELWRSLYFNWVDVLDRYCIFIEFVLYILMNLMDELDELHFLNRIQAIAYPTVLQSWECKVIGLNTCYI